MAEKWRRSGESIKGLVVSNIPITINAMILNPFLVFSPASVERVIDG